MSNRELVLSAIRDAGREGITCDEIEIKLQLTHQTASARVHYLMKSRIVADSGACRKSRSGKNCVVYVVDDGAAPFTRSKETAEIISDDISSSRFWKSVRESVTKYLKSRLSLLSDHERKLFVVELNNDLMNLTNTWVKKLGREIKATEESQRIGRGTLHDACRALGLELPNTIGVPLDLDEARQRKQEIARNNHPDLGIGNISIMDTAVQAFKVIEKYNSQVKKESSK